MTSKSCAEAKPASRLHDAKRIEYQSNSLFGSGLTGSGQCSQRQMWRMEVRLPINHAAKEYVMKSWFQIFVICSLLVAPSWALAEQPTAAPINPAFEAYVERGLTATMEEGENSFGYAPSPVDLSHLEGNPPKPTNEDLLWEKGQAAEIERKGLESGPDGEFFRAPSAPGALPTSYDARTYGYVSSVKNQNPCGTCWAFGVLGQLEARLLKTGQGTYDFSEQSLVTCGRDQWLWTHCDGGGNSYIAANSLTRLGTVTEGWDPYDPTHLDSSTCDWWTPQVLNVTKWQIITNSPSSITAIKTAIYNDGPVTSALYMTTSATYFDSATHSLYYPSCTHDTNHIIVIVGWDDNYTCPAFPGAQGAWLVKNSWGPAWGDAGYFHVFYQSAKIGTETTQFKESVLKDGQETIFSWDQAGWVMSYGYGGTNYSAYGAARFQTNADGYLKYVDFWAVDNNVVAEISIYSGWSSGPTGLLYGPQSFTCTNAGYYSVALSTPQRFHINDNFVVVVKFTTSSYAWPVPGEQNANDAFANPVVTTTIESGKTYISLSGSTWQDTATMTTSPAGGVNLGIRARFSNDYKWYAWGAAGGTTSSTPAIVYYNGDLEGGMVIRGTDNAVYYRYYVFDPGWGAWQGLGGATNDEPVLIVNDSYLHVVIRGTDNAIYENRMNRSTKAWSGWTALGGATSAKPAAVASTTRYGEYDSGGVHSVNYLHVVVRGTDNALYWRYRNDDTGVWSAWTPLGGTTNAAPSMAAEGGEYNALAVRGTDNAVYVKLFNYKTGVWTAWTPLGAATSHSPSVAASAQYVDLLVRGTDGAVYYNYLNYPTNYWGSWTSFGGATNDRPLVLIEKNVEHYLVRGTDNALYHKTWTPRNSFSVGWTPVGGILSSPPGGEGGAGQLEALVRGSGGGIYYRWFSPVWY
jgi:C1A family cysteine protease